MESLCRERVDFKCSKCSFPYIKVDEYRSEKPYYYSAPLDPENEHLRTNLKYETVDDITVVDVRTIKDQPSLDNQGFEYFEAPTKLIDVGLSDQNIEPYLQEVASFLRFHLKAHMILVYDYRVSAPTFAEAVGLPRASCPGQPAARWSGPMSQFEHLTSASLANLADLTKIAEQRLDHTKDGGLRRARRHMSEKEAERYLNGEWRVRIVNLWRPIKHVVHEAPIAFCDYYTVRDEDLVAADRISTNYVGEVYYLAHFQKQKWYYLSEQQPNEMALFVSFDSDRGKGPAFCPHASFVDPNVSGEVEKRESLEVRAIVVSELH